MIPALRQAFTDPLIAGQPLTVLVLLHNRLDVVDYRRIKVFAIADELRMHEGNVARALRLLLDRGYLSASGPRRARSYRLMYSVDASLSSLLLRK